MEQDKAAGRDDLVDLAADVVSAYVSNHKLAASELYGLVATVHGSLAQLGQPAPAARPEPRMPIRKTITPDALISFEDGKPYKMLKRHLAGRGMTPAQYREKWGLPADYPMTAPNYSAKRSDLARSFGLGQKRAAAAKAKPTRGSRAKAIQRRV